MLKYENLYSKKFSQTIRQAKYFSLLSKKKFKLEANLLEKLKRLHLVTSKLSCEAQVKNFFYYLENLCSALKILKILYFQPSQDLPVTSWWVLVQETGCNFEYIFWTTTHKATKLGQLTDICKGNNCQESFEQFGGLELSSSSRSNSAICYNYSITNYVKIPVVHFLENVNKVQLKLVNLNY